MTAPAATTRQDPSGIKFKNGYRSLITFENDPDIGLWEITVQFPGLDNGEGIDTTTQHNDRVRTKASRALVEVTDGQFTCAYDSNIFVLALAQCGIEQEITFRAPDGTTEAVYGYLKSLSRDAMAEGEMPTATGIIVVTNEDPVSRAEEDPTVVNVSGT